MLIINDIFWNLFQDALGNCTMGGREKRNIKWSWSLKQKHKFSQRIIWEFFSWRIKLGGFYSSKKKKKTSLWPILGSSSWLKRHQHKSNPWKMSGSGRDAKSNWKDSNIPVRRKADGFTGLSVKTSNLSLPLNSVKQTLIKWLPMPAW